MCAWGREGSLGRAAACSVDKEGVVISWAGVLIDACCLMGGDALTGCLSSTLFGERGCGVSLGCVGLLGHIWA